MKCPVLAIFAVPHNFESRAPKDSELITQRNVRDMAQVAAFQAGNPGARVVRLPNADYFVFNSNQTDLLQEMNAFISRLP